MSNRDPLKALVAISKLLSARNRQYALVGGLAVSIRSEIRFTRDVDLAVIVADDADSEALIYDLKQASYIPVISIENETHGRLATIRLQSPNGVIVDLLFASSGIETEVVTRSTIVQMKRRVELPVANAEELIAMKVLSMSKHRLQDRADVQRLIQYSSNLDIARIQDNLALIESRGYNRDEDLQAKFDDLYAETERLSD